MSTENIDQFSFMGTGEGNRRCSNTEPPADANKVAAELPAFLSKSEVQKFEEIEQQCNKLQADRQKWTSDAATAEVRRRQEEAVQNPTEQTIAAVAAESPDATRTRYANTSETIHRAITNILEKNRPFFAEILTKLATELTRRMQTLADAHKAECEKYGVTYDLDKDALVKSLARLRHHADNTVEGSGAIHPSTMRRLIGAQKASGRFG